MTKDWANFWLDKNNNKDIKKTDFAKEEKKFNVFDLNTINWEKIKSGISKNALCNDNVLLESIFDSVDTDQHKGILSNKELELLKNKIENLAKDKKLGEKEANKKCIKRIPPQKQTSTPALRRLHRTRRASCGAASARLCCPPRCMTATASARTAPLTARSAKAAG